MDSIIKSILVEYPKFNNLEELEMQIEKRTTEFIKDMTAILVE